MKSKEGAWGFRTKSQSVQDQPPPSAPPSRGQGGWGRTQLSGEAIQKMQEKWLEGLEKLEYDKDINFEIQSNVISERNPLRIANYPSFVTKLVKTLCKSGHYNSVGNLLEHAISSRLKHRFKDLGPGQVEGLLSQVFHFVRTMKQREPEVNAALRFLGHLTYENQISAEQISYLLNLLSSEKILSNKFFTKLSQTPRLVVNLQTNILMRNPDGSQASLSTIFNFVYLWFEFLCKNSSHFAGQTFLKNMITCLRALSFVLQDFRSLDDLRATSLFISLHRFLFIGTDLAPKVFSKRAYEQTANVPVIELSDSQLSDQAGASEDAKDPYFRMRTFALHALQNIFKLNCKVIFNHYWYLLLPSFIIRSPAPLELGSRFSSKFETALANEPTLVAMVMREKSLKIRISAVVALSTLLENSPIAKWLGPLEKNNEGKVIAKYDKPLQASPSITPLSQTLGLIIRFMHYILIFLIQRERTILDNTLAKAGGGVPDYSVFHLLSQLVKLAGTLVSVTPYIKMCEGLISALLVPHISELLFNYDDDYLKAAALHCFSQAFGVAKGVRDEVVATLGLQRTQAIEQNDVVGFILLQCPPQQSKARSKAFLALERGALLPRLAKNYGSELLLYWKELSPIFESALASRGFGFENPQDKKKLQFYFLKLLEEWLRQQRTIVDSKRAEQEDPEELLPCPEARPLPVFALPGFRENFVVLLRRHFEQPRKNEVLLEHQSLVLNCLTFLGAPEWEALPPALVTLVVERCLASSEKSQQMLYIAAVKVLGCMACLPFFAARPGFLAEVVGKVTSARLSESNANVFIRLSWTMANTCAMLEAHPVPLGCYVDLFETSLKYVESQKEKSSANGIRSLGFLLRHAPLKALEQKVDLPGVLSSLYASLDAKHPKIAWNACVALGNAIQNPEKTKGMEHTLFSEDLLLKLGDTVEQRENFKVRIHAAQTLRLIEDPARLGANAGVLFGLWERALRGVRSLEQVVVELFSERKYIHSLERHVLELIAHFCGLLARRPPSPLLSDFLAANAKPLIEFATDFLRRTLRIADSLYEKPNADELLPQEEHEQEEEKGAPVSPTKAPAVLDEASEAAVLIVRDICRAVTKFVGEAEDVAVSFAIFQRFEQIAKAESPAAMRELEVLAAQEEHFFSQTND